MKKNLLSIVILGLLVVNLVLTGIMMASVVGTAKKTSALVADISGVLKLELESGETGDTVAADVPMEDIEVYQLTSQMTIPLKMGEDGDPHYCVLSVALSMNTKSDGYKAYGEDIATKESLISDKIYDVVGSYTLEEAQANRDMMREDILASIQQLFNSDFIFQVAFSDIMFQ